MSEEKKTGGARVAGKRQAPTSAKKKRQRGAAAGGIVVVLLLVLAIVAFCGYTAYSVLMNGEAVRVNFGAGNQQYWDIQAIFEDNSSLAWYNIDLLSTAQVTLNNDGTATLQ